jgi:tetratricopeptide (TPR) repeat protein
VAKAPVARLPVIASAPAIASAPVVARAKPTSAVAARALAVQQLLGLKELHPVSIVPQAGVLPTTVAARPASIPSARPAPVPSARPSSAPAARDAMRDDLVARLSTSEGRRKAERLIAEGDELFRSQNFHSALQKYKQAASAAPNLAETHWRSGHALVATHNYDLAARSFKRAVALTDDLSRGGFQLADLYGAATRTKAVHLDSLAEWAMGRGSVSSDPYFLIGLFLQYDGKTARAEKFFEKASDIAGISGGHIAVFLAPAMDVAPTVRTAPHITGASGPAMSGPALNTSIVPIGLSRET